MLYSCGNSGRQRVKMPVRLISPATFHDGWLDVDRCSLEDNE